MLKLTTAITPAMIPTQSGVLLDSKERGNTGRTATLSSTHMKSKKNTGKATAMAIANRSWDIGTAPPLRDNSCNNAPIDSSKVIDPPKSSWASALRVEWLWAMLCGTMINTSIRAMMASGT